jgi:flagellar hook-associated protein FlgK
MLFSSSSSRDIQNDDDAKNEMKISKLKRDLTSLATQTRRGFEATSQDRKAALSIINQLARYNPTLEPAAAYYKTTNKSAASSTAPSLAGKWTLLYTDAPDITSLQQNSLAELGRIGQECEPPFIRNVIEWKKPAWAANLPLSGKQRESRLLQKVVTEASASADKPTTVNLAVAGLSIESSIQENDSSSTSTTTTNLLEQMEQEGWLPTLLKKSPINLQGPWRPPFGQFEILYLDDEFRMIRTGQGYVAVNRRHTAMEDWF